MGGAVGREKMRVVEVDFGVLMVAEGWYGVRGEVGRGREGWVYGYSLWREGDEGEGEERGDGKGGKGEGRREK